MGFLAVTVLCAEQRPLRATDLAPAHREAARTCEGESARTQRPEAFPPATLRVLLCEADDGASEDITDPLQAALLGYSDIALVDIYDARSGTPSLAYLQNYDVVFT